MEKLTAVKILLGWHRFITGIFGWLVCMPVCICATASVCTFFFLCTMHMKPVSAQCEYWTWGNSPKPGSALYPNNKVQLFALSVNDRKLVRLGGQLWAVNMAPWLPVVLARASLPVGLLGREWASLGSSCQCWGGKGIGKAEKVAPTLWSIPSGTQGPVGCAITVL